MAKSFAELLKNRKKNTEKLSNKIESLKKGGDFNNDPDARMWDLKHLRNKDGNGRATIRFLPAPLGEEEEFVLYYSYFEKNRTTGKWYVHASHMSFDKDAEDPAYTYNGTIYSNTNLTDDEKKKLSIRRQKHYVANILVVDDPVEPENNGKVFLFDYGPMIAGLIEKRMNPNPDVDDFEKADPFDVIEGCNFKIKIVSKKLPGVTNLIPNYESSIWEDCAPMADSEEEMEAIWNKCYKLGEFIDPTNTKLYKSIEKQKIDFAAWIGEEAEEEVSKPAPKEKSIKEDALPESEDDDLPETEEDESIIDDDDDDDFFDKFK
ncbi:MAG: hypothetical protein COA52_00350 [Hyphomicrobiales bacterium]|nr:MAG: hypothetical protein COA52_00350 [Hyphomicrobiales bacterium]